MTNCRRKTILEGKDLKEGPCGWGSNHEGQGQTQLEKQQTQLTQGFVNQVIKSVFFKKWFYLFAQALLQLQSMDSRVLELQKLRHKGSAGVAPGSQGTGSIAEAHRLRGSEACGIFPDRDQATFPALAGGFFITEQVDSLSHLAGRLFIKLYN